jgi:hypothetical protein
MVFILKIAISKETKRTDEEYKCLHNLALTGLQLLSKMDKHRARIIQLEIIAFDRSQVKSPMSKRGRRI